MTSIDPILGSSGKNRTGRSVKLVVTPHPQKSYLPSSSRRHASLHARFPVAVAGRNPYVIDLTIDCVSLNIVTGLSSLSSSLVIFRAVS
jgi:hypothetical protein